MLADDPDVSGTPRVRETQGTPSEQRGNREDAEARSGGGSEGNVAPFDRVAFPGDADDTAKPHKYVDDGNESQVSWKAWLYDNEEELVAPAVLLPWRIALFLFTSTLVQNFSYCMTDFMNVYGTTWTDAERSQFYQLCFNMIYLGPVFGLVLDVARVFRERYRPIIILACLVNATLCFLCFGIPTMNAHYGRSLVIEWLMQVATMFIFIPMNAVVISYGNSMLQSPDESSARIGGLMAQAMVVRSFGSFIYQFVYTFARPRITSQPDRWMLLVAAIGSVVLVFQILLPFTMKRSYFVDRREASLKYSAPARFYFSVIRARSNAVSRRKKATNTTFMFVLCFVFIYFMLPDVLYNDYYSFNYLYTSGFSKGLNQAISILGSLGAVAGALAYALWMFFAYENERKHHRLVKTNPFQIVLAGCCAWAFATFFHLFGVMGYSNSGFSWKVFMPFQTLVVQACLRFAFMPTLSLAAMHAPRGYETTAFQLYSVDTTGGGTVSSAVTSSLMVSMGVKTSAGVYNWGKYWKGVLISIFFQFLPLLIALSLPKHRDEDATTDPPEEVGDSEPLQG